MIKVSVIIPVYNTAPYLRRCLDSVCGQTLRDIEIICINDGSTDNSLEILNEYTQKDKRVKIINFKKNKGVSIARNTGIDKAKGKYIGFVDSDDWVDKDFYLTLHTIASKNNVDIAKGGFVATNQNQNTFRLNMLIQKNKAYFCSEFTTAIYQTNFLKKHKIFFPAKLTNGEDSVFVARAALLANLVKTTNDVCYYYVQENSLLNSLIYNYKKIVSYCNMAKIIIDFLNKMKFSETEYNITALQMVGALTDFLFDKTTKTQAKKYIVNKVFCLYHSIKREYRRNFQQRLITNNLELYRYLESDDQEGLYDYLCKRMLIPAAERTRSIVLKNIRANVIKDIGIKKI